jgi:hypothetical protein
MMTPRPASNGCGRRLPMRVLLILAVIVFAGCGHGDHGVVLHAPFIQDLVITALTPLVEGQRGVYEFRVHFTDPDGDLDGGSCEIDTTIGPAQLRLTFAQGSDPEATFGTVVCVFETTVLGRVVSGQFTITDRHGLTSNAIAFTLPAERRRL